MKSKKKSEFDLAIGYVFQGFWLGIGLLFVYTLHLILSDLGKIIGYLIFG